MHRPRIVAKIRTRVAGATTAVLLGSGLVMVTLAPSAHAAPSSVQVLPSLGGTDSVAQGVSNEGQIVGYSKMAGDLRTHAVLWDSSGIHDLGTLGAGFIASDAMFVNDSGEVAGYSSTSSYQHAFEWDATNGMTDLTPDVVNGCADPQVKGIDSTGEVLINEQQGCSGLVTHAYVWDRAHGLTDLGTLGGASTSAYAISASGTVTGTSAIDASNGVPFVWTRDGGMINIAPAGYDGWGTAINDKGDVAGTMWPSDGSERLFLWNAVDGATDLGGLGGLRTRAFAINDADQIVGFSTIDDGPAQHPIRWDPINGMVDIGPTDSVQLYELFINNGGQIAGALARVETEESAYAWTPQDTSAPLDGHDDLVASAAYAMNDSGMVVGVENDGPIVYATEWSLNAPSIQVTTPTAGTYPPGTSLNASFSCLPDSTPVVSCSASTGSGAALPMDFGQHTFTVTATDADGFQSTSSVAYTVAESVTETVPDGGGTVTTPTPASSANPVQTSVTTPSSGAVSINETAVTAPTPAGYTLLGTQLNITAPSASSSAPLVLTFNVDASVLSAAGVDASTLIVLRDGVPIGSCNDPSSVAAAPDPCVFSRQALAGGSAQISVYSTHASTWNLGKLLQPTAGLPYSHAVAAFAGTAPYHWSVASGHVPPGVSLNPDTGIVAGTPTQEGNYTFMVRVTDSALRPKKVNTPLTIAIAPAELSVGPNTLPNATAHATYSTKLTASGGTAAYKFTVASGALPPGLKLSGTGAFTGKPTATGTFAFTVGAVDKYRFTTSTNLTITVIAPSIAIAPTSLPNATVFVRYSAKLTAAGGSAPYKFAVTSGALPPGITLSSAGALAGKPTAVGTDTFTVTTTDKYGFTSIDTRTLTVT